MTAARTGEVLGARWREISLVERLWTIRRECMKAGREHRVPLSDAAIAVLDGPQPVALQCNGKPEPAAEPQKPGSNSRPTSAAHAFKRIEVVRDASPCAQVRPQSEHDIAIARQGGIQLTAGSAKRGYREMCRLFPGFNSTVEKPTILQ